MYTFTVENQYGQVLELTHNDAYAVKSILGLDPPDGIINTVRNAGQDGSVFNSAYMDERVITITLAINYPAEINRINLYKYFKIKYPIKIRYKNGSRNVWIIGYTQSVQIAYFDKKETAQITVRCPDPYFNDDKTTMQEMSNVLALFEFPFDIEETDPVEMSRIELGREQIISNGSDVPIGMKIRIYASGNVVNPQIYNVRTGEFLKILDTMITGDVIEISTMKGSKSAIRYREGVKTSMIGYFAEGSVWLQLLPGENVMSMYAEVGAENLYIDITSTDQYEGV
jgi:hypothetical protein